MAANNHTSVQTHSKTGHQVKLQHTTTDSPILPAENLRQLSAIDPSLVQWVINQTELEAEHRRKQESRINVFVFTERLSGIAAGTFVALFGLALGGYLILNGHDWAGLGISGVSLTTIVSILVTRKKVTSDDSAQTKKSPQNKN